MLGIHFKVARSLNHELELHLHESSPAPVYGGKVTKLLEEIGMQRYAVKITETFHEGLDSKMGAEKVGDPIEFKYSDCDG